LGDDDERGAMWRGLFSAGIGVVWLIGILLWWAFFSEDYEVAQKFAVTIVSIVVIGAIVSALWLPFASRWAEDEEERKQLEEPGFKLRVVASMVVFFALGLGLAYMLYGPWKDFTFCQSIVIIIVILIVFAVIMAPVWIGWGKRKGSVKVRVELDDVAEEISESIEEAIEDAYEKRDRDDD
jgi:Na+/melibiose symporter-like transporter